MREENKIVYIADDGKSFETYKQCEDYEKELIKRMEKTTFWQVFHSPDLTEGRGFYKLTYIECYGPENYDSEMFIKDWCYRTFNRPIAFIMGICPTENWKLSKIHQDTFNNQNAKTSVGDYSYKAERIKLIVGEK